MGELYTVRTTSGRENIVIDMIYTNVKMNSLKIASIVHPGELKGYVFIEAPLEEVKKAVHGVMHVKGIIEKPVSIDEIRRFFEPKKTTVIFGEDDIVEIIGGPFKREKGKIQRIDNVKDEVTVELLEASIPIPVTIATELVRLVKRGKKGAAAAQKRREEEEKQKKEEKGSVFDNLGEEPEKKEEPEEKPESKPEKKPEEEPKPEEKKETPAEEVKKEEKPEEKSPEEPPQEKEKEPEQEKETPEEPGPEEKTGEDKFKVASKDTEVPEKPDKKEKKKIELSAKEIPIEDTESGEPEPEEEKPKEKEAGEEDDEFLKELKEEEKKEKKKKKDEDEL